VANDVALLRLVRSSKGWRRRSVPERAEALGRIGGIVLTVALSESGGLSHERRVRVPRKPRGTAFAVAATRAAAEVKP